MAAAKLQKLFDSNPDVSFVRFVVMDYASMLRVSSIAPKRAALQIAKDGSVNAPISQYVAASNAFDGFNADAVRRGFDLLVPDWNSLRVCTFYPRHAMVMCSVKLPVDQAKDETTKIEDGKEEKAREKDGWELCPRAALTKQVLRAEAAGQNILVGIEVEFCLYRPGADFSRAKDVAHFNTSTLSDPVIAGTLDEIALTLERADIHVMKYHPEAGFPSLFEMVLPPYTPMQAADVMVFTRETIKTVARQRGLDATLSPFPFEKGASGVGAHTTISISDTGPDGAKAESFLAGLLASLRGVTAFAQPSPQSEQRVGPVGHKPMPVCWGRDNKTCAISERRLGVWEVRVPDGSMNPYLTIAALIASGMAGIERKMNLTMKPVDKMVLDWTVEAVAEIGNPPLLSVSLGNLLADLKKDDTLRSALGEDLITSYTVLKEKELEAARLMTIAELGEKMRLVF